MVNVRSLPPRGAWIEIANETYLDFDVTSLPHGERGLKSVARLQEIAEQVVAPPTGSVD